MSKLKVSGNASGTGVITLEAPNTNTDRTITLPDEDITLGGGVDGIVSTANATAITIDASEQVGIGVTSPQELLHLKDGSIAVGNGTASNNAQVGRIGFSTDSANSRFIGMECYRGSDAANGDLRFHTYGGDSDAGERLRITNDGRGLSQFTAKAWCFIEWNNTIYDSHNVSSITELGTGHSRVNFTNNMGNSNFAVASSSEGSHITSPSARATSNVSMRILQPTTGSWTDGQISVVIFGD